MRCIDGSRYIFPEGSSESFDSAFNLTTSNVNDDMLTKCHYMYVTHA